jgi:3-oxoacyl-[acyl-carrier protein] reductase
MKLENRNAIVTGAAKGMGSVITLTLARVRQLGRRAEVIAADVTDETQVQAMVEQAKAFFGGRIDILINVAGVTGPIETPVWEIDAADFSQVIETNIRGTFLPIKHVVPAMIAQRSGKVVNIGGTSGLRGYKYRAAYSASKWAVRGLTRTVALEVGEYGINVNVLCPGIVRTPRMDRLCEEKARVRGSTYEQVYDEYIQEMALRRVTEPQDVANAVLFLASEESRNITGQEITVDGGWDV